EGHGLVDVMHDLTTDDERRLRRLIENHRRYTDSERAKAILENWQAYLPKFVKVMPVEFRKALQKMAARRPSVHPHGNIERLEIGVRPAERPAKAQAHAHERTPRGPQGWQRQRGFSNSRGRTGSMRSGRRGSAVSA